MHALIEGHGGGAGGKALDAALRLPPAVRMARFGQPFQLFLSFDMPSMSLTHRDDTNSVLTVLTGHKILFLAPPGAHEQHNLPYWNKPPDVTDRFLDYNPFRDAQCEQKGWRPVRLLPGDSCFIPKNWWHNVLSSPNSSAISRQVVISSDSVIGDEI